MVYSRSLDNTYLLRKEKRGPKVVLEDNHDDLEDHTTHKQADPRCT
jgi:hypothetical protein